jgi:hypothetical protein
MNSLDENYAPAVLLLAVSFISSPPKNCTSIRIKIFNRLHFTLKNQLNQFNLVFYNISDKFTKISLIKVVSKIYTAIFRWEIFKFDEIKLNL